MLCRIPDVKPKQYFAVISTNIKIFQIRKLFPKAGIKISLEMVRNSHYLPSFQCYARPHNKLTKKACLVKIHYFWKPWLKLALLQQLTIKVPQNERDVSGKIALVKATQHYTAIQDLWEQIWSWSNFPTQWQKGAGEWWQVISDTKIPLVLPFFTPCITLMTQEDGKNWSWLGHLELVRWVQTVTQRLQSKFIMNKTIIRVIRES